MTSSEIEKMNNLMKRKTEGADSSVYMSTELDEWQVENWGYVKDRPDDYTHWMTLPEPPKGE